MCAILPIRQLEGLRRLQDWWPLVTKRTLDEAQRNAFELGRDAERLGL